jgi:hypothetical protein
MAKAWRKHNMDLAGKIKLLDKDIAFISQFPEYVGEDLKKFQVRRDQLSGLRLRNKTERRMQYASEVSQPSNTLYILFAHVGLPVPTDFLSALQMRMKNGAAGS